MFKDKRVFLQKNMESERSVESELFPIVSAESLLKVERRQKLMKVLPALSQLKERECQLYIKTAYIFAEFVQQLPENKNSYYPYAGGLLDHGLERAIRALALSRNYFIDHETDSKELLAKQAMLRYAIFSVALFYDVGYLVTKLRVKICNKEGAFVKYWHPYDGSMVSQGTHYRYIFEKENWDYLRVSVTPLLAQQLMKNASGFELTQIASRDGFSWIARDKEVLETWFALFREESQHPDSLLSIIPLADAQAIARYFDFERPFDYLAEPELGFWDKYGDLLANFAEESLRQGVVVKAAQEKINLERGNVEEQERLDAFEELEKQKERPLEKQEFESMSVEVGERKMAFVPATMAAGVAFMRWLLKSLQAKQLSVGKNDSLIHRVSNGVLLEKGLFEKFTQEQAKYKNADIVQKQFANLGINLNGAAGQNLFRFTSDRLGGVKEGMVVGNPYLVFQGKDSMPVVNKALKVIGDTANSVVNNKLVQHYVFNPAEKGATITPTSSSRKS